MTFHFEPEFWEDPKLRTALNNRDVDTLYRHLFDNDMSIFEISYATKQPEISIINSLRTRGESFYPSPYLTYAELAKIADGLGFSREYFNLSNDTPNTVRNAHRTSAGRSVQLVLQYEFVNSRPFMAHVAELTMGTIPTATHQPDLSQIRALLREFKDSFDQSQESTYWTYDVRDHEPILDDANRAPRNPIAKAPRRAVGLASRLLPSNDRVRYLDEYLSELDELAQSSRPSRAQINYAFRLLVHAPALRLALREPGSKARR